jgi:hypothetical protein
VQHVPRISPQVGGLSVTTLRPAQPLAHPLFGAANSSSLSIKGGTAIR